MSSSSAPNAREDVRELVERVLADQLGLSLAAYSDALVRIVLAALPDPLDERSPELLRTLVTSFGIGETSFLRHREHFVALRALAPSLPSACLRRPLSVWSAGCATGEEAYSIGATLEGMAAEVRGSDVNAASIERARAGTYRLWSLRGVSLDEVEPWLDVQPLEIRVRDPLRSSVGFDVRNLVHDPYPRELDAAFCRNVLLYFQSDAARSVYERLASAIAIGGVLFIGYADPEPPLSRFRPEDVRGVRCYRRADADEASSAPLAPTRREPERAHDRTEPASSLHEAREVLAMVRGLAGQRELARALELLAQLAQSREHALAVEAHVLTSMIADEAGQPALALAAARRAWFLAPNEPVTLYLLGAALGARGAPDLARDRLHEAEALLDRRAGAEVLLPYGEGLTAGQLKRMIRARLEAR